MATNYPTGLDDITTLPEPTTGSTIPAAADTNRSQAIKAIESKLGTGDDTAANGEVLIGNGAGSTEYRALVEADISDFGTYQAEDAQLTSLAGLVPGAEGRTITADGLGGFQMSAPSDMRTYLNVEDGADVTDTTNVTAAGALMDSEVTNLADVKAFDPADYATAAQGTTADSALQPSDIAGGTITARTGAIDFSGGSDGDVLTVQADGSLAPETPAAGGGQMLYDAIVAPSGGDYTTLGAALTAGATRIFVRNGTYSESAISNSTNDLLIVGESRKGVSLSFGDNDCTFTGNNVQLLELGFDFTTGGTLTSNGEGHIIQIRLDKSSASTSATEGFVFNTLSSLSVVRLSDITIDTPSTSSYDIVNYGDRSDFVNNRIFVRASRSAGSIAMGGNNNKFGFDNNVVDLSTSSGANPVVYVSSGFPSTIRNNIIRGGNTSSAVTAIKLNSYQCLCSGNSLIDVKVGVYLDQSYNAVKSNYIRLTANGIGVDTDGVSQDHMINDNFIYGTTGCVGIRNIYRNTQVLNNTTFSCPTGIEFKSASVRYNTVVGNKLASCATAVFSNFPTTDGSNFGNNIYGNTWDNFNYASEQYTQKWARMEVGGSGLSLNTGEVMSYEATSGLNHTVPSSTASDWKYIGVNQDFQSTGNHTHILTEGRCTNLDVDGSGTSIAIGDPLTTSTTSGVAVKATSGQLAFAIANQAASSATSISAQIIKPRTV